MFGRSFNDIGTAIVGKINDINKAFQVTDDLIGSVKNSDSIWKRLYPSKESLNAQLIDVDSLIPEMDEKSFNFDLWINRLNVVDKKIKSGAMSWQDFSNSLADNQKWIAKWGQETEGQIRTQNGLVKANQAARASALAHNEAIKAQTFSAKAESVALKALSIAGNMILFTAITKGIQLATTAIDNYIHRVEKAAEKTKEINNRISDLNSKHKSHADLVQNVAKRYEELSKGVNSIDNSNMALSNDEYAEFLDISNQLVDAFPELYKGLDKNNNTILNIGTGAQSASEFLQELIEKEEQLNNVKIANELDELFKNVSIQIESAEKEVSKLEEELNNLDTTWKNAQTMSVGDILGLDRLEIGDDPELQNAVSSITVTN